MGRTSDIKIINDLRKKIRSGGFDQVTFLPSERKLAEEYQVGRGIIRGALKVLSEEGVLYNVPRRGFRVKKITKRRLKRIILRLPIQMSARAYEAIGLVDGICAGANDIFAEVILSTPPAKLNLSELKERYNANDIQGIIFLESSPDLAFDDIVKAGIPFVIANLEEEKMYPGVCMDYRGIGRSAGMELIQRGYRNIAVYSGSPEHYFYREILAGFRGALAEEKIPFDDAKILIGNWNDPPPAALRKLLSKSKAQRPDAIFTLRDYRAAQVFSICEELALNIPDELGVISFDGITWPGAEKAGLSTISEEVSEIGRQAVALLQQQFESGYDPVKLMISGTLLPGKSLREKKSSTKVVYKQ
ncbi:MAG: GntR family transcriptional regulator [Lentisphaerae bacterium]|nr:GntR family transcriptional regulator [Lentisphaerota bacterium]